MDIYDLIIIGTGPASASFGLKVQNKDLKILFIDGGNKSHLTNLSNDNFQSAYNNSNEHIVEYLDNLDTGISPKFNTPLSRSFDYNNEIALENFDFKNFLSIGGYSNLWGAGVSLYDKKEINENFPFDYNEINSCYDEVLEIIGASRQEPQKELNQKLFSSSNSHYLPTQFSRILKKYYSSKQNQSFKLSPSTIAVLNKDEGVRKKCNYCDKCLYGCERGSIYNSTYNIDNLITEKNTNITDNTKVINLRSGSDLVIVECLKDHKKVDFFARKVAVGAGTIQSTILALKLAKYYNPVRLIHAPSAAFLAIDYNKRILEFEPKHSLSNLNFEISNEIELIAYGNIFPTTGIHPSFFYPYISNLPIKFFNTIYRNFSSNIFAGNIFLDGKYSNTSIQFQKGDIKITGGEHEQCEFEFLKLKKSLSRELRKLNCLILPYSFNRANIGADFHYVGTLPMSKNPEKMQTNRLGCLNNINNIHFIDGSILPHLPAKAHTTTIMANAIRIASEIY